MFGIRRIDVYLPEYGNTERTLRTISFIDINGDGYLDIIENEKVEKVTFDEQLNNLNDYYKLKVEKLP